MLIGLADFEILPDVSPLVEWTNELSDSDFGIHITPGQLEKIGMIEAGPHVELSCESLRSFRAACCIARSGTYDYESRLVVLGTTDSNLLDCHQQVVESCRANGAEATDYTRISRDRFQTIRMDH